MLSQVTISGFADEIDPSLDKQIKVLESLSMNAMEMRGVDGKCVVEYSLDEVREFKKKLDEHGIHLSAIGSPIGKIMITEDFEEHYQLFQHTVEIAKIMQTPNIRMFSFFLPESEDPSQYKEEVFRRLRRMAEYAKEQQVVLFHENEKDIYGDVASRCAEIMEEFYGENFKAIFDFANFVQCGQDTLEAYAMLKKYIGYIHIKDAHLVDKMVVPAGMGDGNVKQILEQVIQEGKVNVLSLEPHLTEFKGFLDLEQTKTNRTEQTIDQPFVTAYEALQKILREIEA